MVGVHNIKRIATYTFYGTRVIMLSPFCDVPFSSAALHGIL